MPQINKHFLNICLAGGVFACTLGLLRHFLVATFIGPARVDTMAYSEGYLEVALVGLFACFQALEIWRKLLEYRRAPQ